MTLDRELKYLDIYEGKGENSIKKLSENASDIIMFKYDRTKNMGIYHNFMTGEKNGQLHKVVRNDRNHICMTLYKNPTIINGYFIYYNKKHDVLVLKLARIVVTEDDIQTWKPIKESENKMDTVYESCFVFKRNGNCYIPFKPVFKNMLSKLDNEKFIDAFSSQASSIANTYNDYSLSLIRDFFGETICDSGLHFKPVNTLSILANIARMSQIKSTNKNDFINHDDFKEISSENKKKVYDIFMKNLSNIEIDYIKNHEEFFNNFIINKTLKVAVLNKISDSVSVIRIFFVVTNALRVFKNNIPLSEDELIIDEVIRIYCNDNTTSVYKKSLKEWFLCRDGLKAMNFEFVLIDAPENAINNCRFKYFRSQINTCVDLYKKIEEKENNASQILEELEECEKASADLFSTLTFSLYESFIKMELGNLSSYLIKGLSPKSKLKQLFGDINNKETSITKALGVSTFMLKELDNFIGNIELKKEKKLMAYTIRILKYIFKDNKEYFESMNKEQFIGLLSDINDFNKHALFSYSYFAVDGIYKDIEIIFYLLVKHNGHKNLSNYFKSLTKIAKDCSVASSMSFFNRLKDYVVISDKTIEENEEIFYKFKDVYELEDSHDYVVSVYNLKSNKIKNKEYSEKFEKRIPSWKKYTYSDNTYSVIYPQCYLDIASEGIALHHCVKSYIDSVVEGKTNILFIRRNEEINKPFFTLEIRNNEVRQCHGFANCNTSTVDGLDDFLRHYCDDKNIKYNNGNSVRAV